MSGQITNSKDLIAALKRGPYAWPGGYPVFFITHDGNALSFAYVKKKAKDEAKKISSKDRSRIVAIDVNWENPELYCEETGKRIESAYADDRVPPEELAQEEQENAAARTENEAKRRSHAPRVTEAINLEGMTPTDLNSFIRRYGPNPKQHGDYRDAVTQQLWKMAYQLREARNHRLAGRIQDATRLEEYVQMLYEQLPEEFRW